MTEPIPHWPGRLVSVSHHGVEDHEVFVRSAPVGAVADEIGVLLGMPGGFRRLTQARVGDTNTQPVRY